MIDKIKDQDAAKTRVKTSTKGIAEKHRGERKKENGPDEKE